MMFPDRRDRWWLLLACVALVILWMPGLQYPILSDTAHYALLGESFWHGRGYVLLGEPYARHLPLHAIVSYPLVAVAGYAMGMKVSSLLSGMGVLLVSFALCRRRFGRLAALGVVGTLLLHHSFVWMTVVGSADLLFTTLALGAILAFSAAEDDRRWYLASGLLMGLASLTRYNGVPLFGFSLLAAFLWRRSDLRSGWFWSGLLAGTALFVVWTLRNALVFGDPLYTEYTGELADTSQGPVSQIVSNALFYAHPLHNVLPVLLLSGLYGLWRLRRREAPLILAMVSLLLLTAVWWVQAMRFAFPVFPLLLGFAWWGIYDLSRRFPEGARTASAVLLGAVLIATHLAALCLYAYPTCNAAVDREVGILPKDLGLTSEGFHAFDEARDWFNASVPRGAAVLVGPIEEITWARGVFREDVRLTSRDACPYYRITGEPLRSERVLFQTPPPTTMVVLRACSDSEEELP